MHRKKGIITLKGKDPFRTWKPPNYTVKTRKARNATNRGFGCLELSLYSIRELVWQQIISTNQSTVSWPMRGLHSVPKKPAHVTAEEKLLKVWVSPLQPPPPHHLCHHLACHLLLSPRLSIFLWNWHAHHVKSLVAPRALVSYAAAGGDVSILSECLCFVLCQSLCGKQDLPSSAVRHFVQQVVSWVLLCTLTFWTRDYEFYSQSKKIEKFVICKHLEWENFQTSELNFQI